MLFRSSLETDPVTVDTALMESVARLPRFASVAPYAVKGGKIGRASCRERVSERV